MKTTFPWLHIFSRLLSGLLALNFVKTEHSNFDTSVKVLSVTTLGLAVDLNLDLQLYYQLVHPLTTTVIAPMLVLIILNYFILARWVYKYLLLKILNTLLLSRVAARRVRSVSSRVTRRMERSQARLSVMVGIWMARHQDVKLSNC